ncbi:MAG: CoA transferase [Dehalococcoidales bacterium]|nr:CoA transferase [Dehalococcoidales bacterium]
MSNKKGRKIVQAMNDGALKGIRVLEYGEFISAAYCGKMLADLGAEVIKLEKPGSGDRARQWGPFPDNTPHAEKSGLFLFLNNNKSGITLDVTRPDGAGVFRKLAAWADILIESNPPAMMEDLGFTYDNLKKLNPSLIMTSITPFGQTGPYRDYKGSDLITSHTSGEAFGNPAEGVDDMERYSPLKGPMHAADFMTGLSAAVSTMPAILVRQAGGGGRYIDISAQESVASVLRQELAFCMCEGLCPTRELGRKRRGGILYPASDGFVCLWIGPHWSKMVDMMGKPDWTQIEMFQSPIGRAEHVEDFDRLMALWTIEHTMQEIDNLAIEFGVPCSPVRSVKEVLADEQLAFRNYFVEIDHPEAGKFTYPGAPYKLSGTPWAIRNHAPLLGQHNKDIYCGELGYSRENLAEMKQAGII